MDTLLKIIEVLVPATLTGTEVISIVAIVGLVAIIIYAMKTGYIEKPFILLRHVSRWIRCKTTGRHMRRGKPIFSHRDEKSGKSVYVQTCPICYTTHQVLTYSDHQIRKEMLKMNREGQYNDTAR